MEYRAREMMTSWQLKRLQSCHLQSHHMLLLLRACQLIYAYGRSHFKINSVTKASTILKPVAEKCVNINDDVGAKAYYLIGKSYERKKRAEAAKAFEYLNFIKNILWLMMDMLLKNQLARIRNKEKKQAWLSR